MVVNFISDYFLMTKSNSRSNNSFCNNSIKLIPKSMLNLKKIFPKGRERDGGRLRGRKGNEGRIGKGKGKGGYGQIICPENPLDLPLTGGRGQ